MKYNIFSTLSANLDRRTFKSLTIVFWNLLKTQVLLDEKANSAPFLDISRYMSEPGGVILEIKPSVSFSILWPKPCLSNSYEISLMLSILFQILPVFRKKLKSYLFDKAFPTLTCKLPGVSVVLTCLYVWNDYYWLCTWCCALESALAETKSYKSSE